MAVEEHINRRLSVKTSRRPLATPLTLAWCYRVQSEALPALLNVVWALERP